MRVIWLLLATVAAGAAPLPWDALPPALARLLRESGLQESGYFEWQQRHRNETAVRLDEGAAEHITYFLMQSKLLASDPPLDPAGEARRYLNGLSASDRSAFLGGAVPGVAFSEAVRRRMDAFWKGSPGADRHRVLREMDRRLGWPPERVVGSAFRFLMRRADSEDADAIYQQRGLSADPFPASMRAVERALPALGAIDAVLLAGPGAEFGSRFGVDDAKPVPSPQPAALLRLLPQKPATFDCVDIRPEVTASLAGSPCRATTGDLVVDRLPAEKYDLAVATNVLVYLNDQELALALANLAQALKPGGCLLHNDTRFAARLFGEAAGIPVRRFEAVSLGSRNGREQMDRIVVHCKLTTTP